MRKLWNSMNTHSRQSKIELGKYLLVTAGCSIISSRRMSISNWILRWVDPILLICNFLERGQVFRMWQSERGNKSWIRHVGQVYFQTTEYRPIASRYWSTQRNRSMGWKCLGMQVIRWLGGSRNPRQSICGCHPQSICWANLTIHKLLNIKLNIIIIQIYLILSRKGILPMLKLQSFFQAMVFGLRFWK